MFCIKNIVLFASGANGQIRFKLEYQMCRAFWHSLCSVWAVKLQYARSVLTVWERLLLRGRPREICIRAHPHPPYLVWTDAQLRSSASPRLGGFIACPSGCRAYFIAEMVESMASDGQPCIVLEAISIIEPGPKIVGN